MKHIKQRGVACISAYMRAKTGKKRNWQDFDRHEPRHALPCDKEHGDVSGKMMVEHF